VGPEVFRTDRCSAFPLVRLCPLHTRTCMSLSAGTAGWACPSRPYWRELRQAIDATVKPCAVKQTRTESSTWVRLRDDHRARSIIPPSSAPTSTINLEPCATTDDFGTALLLTRCAQRLQGCLQYFCVCNARCMAVVMTKHSQVGHGWRTGCTT
jgi:hypothetical protein